MPHEKLSRGEINVLIDGETDNVAFDLLLIHLGIRRNPAERPGPPTVEEALVALMAVEKLVTAGLVRVGRVEYIDGGPPGGDAPVKHVSEPVDVVRQRVVSHLESGDVSDNWRRICWVANTELGDLAARHALEGESQLMNPKSVYMPTIEAKGFLERAIGHTAFQTGSWSLIYIFDGFDETGDGVQFGGIIQELHQGDAAGGPFVATIRFWNESARIYATRGSTFRIWYGEVVGNGKVVRVRAGI